MLNKKLTTVITTGAILLNAAFIPAMANASTTAGVVGNGAESNNVVTVTQNNNSTTTQNNNATITNHIDASSNTGGNDANFNTGGNTKVQTGAASNAVSVSNTANSNFVGTNNPCNCANGATVQVGGNGAFSNNAATLTNNNNNVATQNNNANFTNDIKAHATTGGNSASDNTGGDSSIFTGPASNYTEVDNTANKNVMQGFGIGNGNGSTTLKIDGNGALSTNAVVDTNNTNAVTAQNNSATFFNNVDANAKTGKNTGDFNTDGSTQIQTGGAYNWTGVANIANQNVMDSLNDCGCATGDLFKANDNGAFSGNAIVATANNNKTAAQNNAAAFSNYADPHAFTGDNSVSDATGSYWMGSDPSVMTGAAGSDTQVVNTSNENSISSNGVDMGGMNWQFTWNPSAFLGWMGM